MKIESIIKRPDGHEVRMDDVTYEFNKDNGYTAEVEERTHIAKFLIAPEAYMPGDESSVPDEVNQLIDDQHEADAQAAAEKEEHDKAEAARVAAQRDKPQDDEPEQEEEKPAPAKKKAARKKAGRTPRQR